jgi:hypothetical protein
LGRGVAHETFARQQQRDQFSPQLRQFPPAALEGRAMLELWIHRAKVLEQQFNGVDLPLIANRR